MWRRDRTHPIVVTEYFSETYRNTDPWNQMPRRMLRHKAFKECARLTFGFSGIVDEDEARDMKPIVVQEKIAQAQAIDDLDAFAAATTFSDSSAGVSSPSAAAEQGGGGDEGLQQASVPAVPFDESPAVNKPPAQAAGEGSGETLETPRAPSSLPPDAARKALITSAMTLATHHDFDLDTRLSMLDDLRRDAAGKVSADLIKQAVEIGAKVARKELTKAAGAKYLDQLP
jgi:hypothetical protein